MEQEQEQQEASSPVRFSSPRDSGSPGTSSPTFTEQVDSSVLNAVRGELQSLFDEIQAAGAQDFDPLYERMRKYIQAPNDGTDPHWGSKFEGAWSFLARLSEPLTRGYYQYAGSFAPPRSSLGSDSASGSGSPSETSPEPSSPFGAKQEERKGGEKTGRKGSLAEIGEKLRIVIAKPHPAIVRATSSESISRDPLPLRLPKAASAPSSPYIGKKSRFGFVPPLQSRGGGGVPRTKTGYFVGGGELPDRQVPQESPGSNLDSAASATDQVASPALSPLPTPSS